MKRANNASQAIRRAPARRQHGVALLTVMFIMALMMTLAAYMVEEQHLSIRRAQNSLQSEFAFQAALAGEQLALAVLREDLNQDMKEARAKPINDHLKEEWAKFEKPDVPIDFELGPIQGDNKNEKQTLTIKIIDESAKFNLNNLFTPVDPDAPPGDPWSISWREGFKGLLEALDLDPGLSWAVMEWLDPNDQIEQPTEFSAEDNDYLLEDPPYRTANRLMEDISELALLKGFDEEVIEKLRPYVTALPSYGAKVNANTCEPELFQTLFVFNPNAGASASNVGNHLTSGDAESIVTQLDRTGSDGIPITGTFKQTFNDVMKGFGNIRPREQAFFGDRSSYFKIISQIKVGDISYGVESLVKRIWLDQPGSGGPYYIETDEIRGVRALANQSSPNERAYVKVIQRRRTIS